MLPSLDQVFFTLTAKKEAERPGGWPSGPSSKPNEPAGRGSAEVLA